MHQNCDVWVYFVVAVLAAVFGPLIALLINIMRGSTDHIHHLGITIGEYALGSISEALLVTYILCHRG